MAGVTCTAPSKVGRDAGELVRARRHRRRRRPTTSTRSSPSAPTACCTCRAPATSTRSAGCSRPGSNVVTTRGEFHRPASLDPDVRERVEAACARAARRSTAPAAARLHHRGRAAGADVDPTPARPPDDRRVRQPVAARLPGAALRASWASERPPADLAERRLAHLRGQRSARRCELVAEALALPLDSVEAQWRGRRRAATTSTSRPAPLGRGHRRGSADHRVRDPGRSRAPAVPCQLVLHRPTWTRAWDLQDTGWRVSVEGDTPLDVTSASRCPLEQMAASVARLHGAPGRQRRPVRVRRRAGYPHERRAPSDHRHAGADDDRDRQPRRSRYPS